ncbi:hypothetical protein BH10ACI1_BH10ACI1_33650 [soil metagenome]
MQKKLADKFAEVEKEIAEHKTLGQVLSWANSKPKGDFLPQLVAAVLPHDIIVPYKNLILVYDTT